MYEGEPDAERGVGTFAYPDHALNGHLMWAWTWAPCKPSNKKKRKEEQHAKYLARHPEAAATSKGGQTPLPFHQVLDVRDRHGIVDKTRGAAIGACPGIVLPPAHPLIYTYTGPDVVQLGGVGE